MRTRRVFHIIYIYPSRNVRKFVYSARFVFVYGFSTYPFLQRRAPFTRECNVIVRTVWLFCFFFDEHNNDLNIFRLCSCTPIRNMRKKKNKNHVRAYRCSSCILITSWSRYSVVRGDVFFTRIKCYAQNYYTQRFGAHPTVERSIRIRKRRKSKTFEKNTRTKIKDKLITSNCSG